MSKFNIFGIFLHKKLVNAYRGWANLKNCKKNTNNIINQRKIRSHYLT